MRVQRSLTQPRVVPAQVWDGLTATARAGAIQLRARLASNLVIPESQSPRTEIAPCHADSIIPRFDPSIATVSP
jgi:hypothetical protein